MTVQLRLLRPDGDAFAASWLLGRLFSAAGGSSVDSDGIVLRASSTIFEVPPGRCAVGDVIDYRGARYVVRGVDPVPPFFARDRIVCELRAPGATHGNVAAGAELNDADMGITISAELRRRTGDRHSATGRRALGPAADVRIKVESTDRYMQATDRSLRDARHEVTLYGVDAGPGDLLSWGGHDHIVLRVTGLLEAAGERFDTRVVTD